MDTEPTADRWHAPDHGPSMVALDLLEHMDDAVILLDERQQIIYLNGRAEALAGRTRAELLGSAVSPFLQNLFGPWFARETDHTGVPDAVFEAYCPRIDTWLSVHSRKTAAGHAIFLRHIGAQKRAEEALRESEASLDEAQRLAHLGSWEWDIERDALRWSDETYRILGHAPQSFTPTHEQMLAAIHPDDRELIRRGIVASLAGDAPDSLDHRIVRPDGTVRVVHQRAGLLRDETGRPVKQVGIMLDITERRALESQLTHQAFHDPLTGLANRALFLDRLGLTLARARRGDEPGAVLFVDLDNFKDVNDTRGHDVGDQLLVAVAQRLRAALRESDTLARLGGDEFAVLLERVADADAAARAATRLLNALALPFRLGQQDQRVGVSIGVTLVCADYARPEDVLRDADVALYRAKGAGRGRLALFDPAMQAALADRLALERELWLALERDEFALHYQPIVDLRSLQVVEVEALVRWRNPARGWVSPTDFIPVAEACGAIRPLGHWVLREVCRQGRAWLDRYPDRSPLLIAVNLSAREFQDGDLTEAVEAALAASNFPAALLRLEITESAAMEDAAASVGALRALRALGVRLALDDFGTGYSSLAYLRHFPVDVLKIDRAFIAEIATDRRNLEICRAITMMAKTLRLEVTAEGIEDARQATLARSFLCDRAQGYYFGRPLPADELAAHVFADARASVGAARNW